MIFVLDRLLCYFAGDVLNLNVIIALFFFLVLDVENIFGVALVWGVDLAVGQNLIPALGHVPNQSQTLGKVETLGRGQDSGQKLMFKGLERL